MEPDVPPTATILGGAKGSLLASLASTPTIKGPAGMTAPRVGQPVPVHFREDKEVGGGVF